MNPDRQTAETTLLAHLDGVEIYDAMSEYESEEEDPICMNPVVPAQLETNSPSISSSQTPDSFLKIIHHLHSGKATSTIFSLDNSSESGVASNPIFTPSRINSKPWAPFWMQADFEFTEMVVREGFHSQVIKKLLEKINGCWASGTSLSFNTYSDFQSSLAAARQFSVQDTLPHETNLPNVYLSLHLWLDKSNVAKTVTKHPIVIRPGFLPSSIQNASGNGGGVLIGYMAIVKNSIGTNTSEDDTLDSVEYAQFKCEVYHEIC
ncbi:hypothetical protein Clacol_000800 [Clathrus columnatus]|uniref:Uncharacterized protein n=1 Tax=Clathrus columnatus TaxID=1419009 RepID=A0AAV4ZZB1_9AGAM|nr:hypothetical protein Clacol_000800 [Clathrus columnatus]